MSIFEPPVSLQLLRGAGIIASALVLASLVRLGAAVPVLEVPRFGLRGMRRAMARKEASFAFVEWWVRHVGGALSLIPSSRRRALDNLTVRAGLPMGFIADEWLALCLLSWIVLGLGGAYLTSIAEMAPLGSVAVMIMGTLLPLARLLEAARERAKQLERSLPNAMDLCVLCMGAGADFPSALRFVVGEMGAIHAVCQEELHQVLSEIGLGRTRVEALRSLAERTDSAAVRDFVAAVCQSETKGTPLVQALDIQATTLRRRRSVLAEEAAAKAAVRLMMPMLLMVVCVLLIVIGPFIVTGIRM